MMRSVLDLITTDSMNGRELVVRWSYVAQSCRAMGKSQNVFSSTITCSRNKKVLWDLRLGLATCANYACVETRKVKRRYWKLYKRNRRG